MSENSLIDETHPRRLRAIMFADVVEYSRIMAMDEEYTSKTVSRLIKKFEAMGAEVNGQLVHTEEREPEAEAAPDSSSTVARIDTAEAAKSAGDASENETKANT